MDIYRHKFALSKKNKTEPKVVCFFCVYSAMTMKIFPKQETTRENISFGFMYISRPSTVQIGKIPVSYKRCSRQNAPSSACGGREKGWKMEENTLSPGGASRQENGKKYPLPRQGGKRQENGPGHPLPRQGGSIRNYDLWKERLAQ